MATINIRLNDELKKDAEVILDELGIGMTAAITLFLKAMVRNQGIPFSLEIPNKKTIKAFKEADNIASGKVKAKRYSNASKLRKDLNV